MKREDLRHSYGLKRDRVRSGRDLLRISKLTRSKLEELRTQISGVFSGQSFDELLYLLAVAALKDVAREDKLLELEEVDPAADRRRGIPDDRDVVRGIPARAKTRRSTENGSSRYTARPGRRRSK